MDWFVQYHQAGADHLIRVKTPEEAIELACRLLDDGRDVWAIGTGSLTDTIAKDQIARIYEIWLRAKPPAVRQGPNPQQPEIRAD